MKNKIKHLEEEIIKHKKLYYSGKSEISDEEYDSLEGELQSLDPNNAVLLIVGSDSFSGKKIKHSTKMLSLQKTYKVEDLENWIDSKEAISTFKYDGSSCSLIYKNGKLHLGKSRGNGVEGENITDKVVLQKKMNLK
jgi:DNA ligase (NAD+)